MSDYYMAQPTCPNCLEKYVDGHLDMIYLNLDPEFKDTHFICPNCKKRIRVHAHIEMDCTVDDQPHCGSDHSCTSRGPNNECYLDDPDGQCADVIKGEVNVKS